MKNIIYNILYLRDFVFNTKGWLSYSLLYHDRVSKFVPCPESMDFYLYGPKNTVLINLDSLMYKHLDVNYSREELKELINLGYIKHFFYRDDSRKLIYDKAHKEIFETFIKIFKENNLSNCMEWDSNNLWNHIVDDSIAGILYEFFQMFSIPSYIKKIPSPVCPTTMLFFPNELWFIYTEIHHTTLLKYQIDNNEIIIRGTDNINTFDQILFGFKEQAPPYQLVFENLLPIPRAEVPLLKLAKFRLNNMELFSRFQDSMDNLYLELEQASSVHQIEHILRHESKEIESALNDISKTLKLEFGEIIRLSLSSIVALGAAVSSMDSAISISLTALAGALFVESVYSKVRNYKEKYSNSEYGYIFLAGKTGLIDNILSR